MILGHDYFDHVAFAYRDRESHKIMIIDPAINDRSFELNSCEMSIYLNKKYTINDIVYVVSQDNFSEISFFPMINEVDTTDEEFKKIYHMMLDDNNFK